MDITRLPRGGQPTVALAAISGTTAKTVRRVIARHESGGAAADSGRPQGRNYDSVSELVADRVERARRAGSPAKRLLPAAQGRGLRGVRAEPAAAGLGA